eukprot:TRINITY_DN24015_c0_g1_i2.p1 TRINITY_DN24015_c0_g1~~TRINITY_DN24015_c0_g1_i2.p1  ORF type:complete len:612 (+),score=194.16 TRINITY_DN24015_c0_g1_i2:271-1836(+)
MPSAAIEQQTGTASVPVPMHYPANGLSNGQNVAATGSSGSPLYDMSPMPSYDQVSQVSHHSNQSDGIYSMHSGPYDMSPMPNYNAERTLSQISAHSHHSHTSHHSNDAMHPSHSVTSMPSLSSPVGNSHTMQGMDASGYAGPHSGHQQSGISLGRQQSTGHVSMPSLLMSSTEREPVHREKELQKKEKDREPPHQVQPGQHIDRSRRVTESGKTIVTTPWYPQGMLKDDIRLCDEVNQLWRLLKLTPGEISVRSRCRSALHDCIRELWPGVTVKAYGSFAYGLSLPGSPLDLVCEGCPDLEASVNTVSQKAKELGFKVEGKYVAPTEGFVLIKAGDVTTYLVFVPVKSRVRQAVTLVRDLLQRFPAAAPVYAVARLLLAQSRCNNSRDGGLCSYALLIMVFHCCFTSNSQDAGELLYNFLRDFGMPQENVIISAREQKEKRLAPGKALVIEDPLDPANNVAAGCTRLVQIKSVFQTSSMTLKKWQSARWAGYRGRSPLSSILAYGDLWERATQQEEEQSQS